MESLELKHLFTPNVKHLLTPNKAINKTTFAALCAIQGTVALLVWSTMSSPVLPKPMGIWHALMDLLRGTDFLTEVMTSTVLALESVGITFVVSLLISYSTVLPIMRPAGQFVSKLRFLSLVGLSFVFLLLVNGGHNLKVALLVFCMVVFFVTSMMDEIASISRSEFNHARTLGMSEWRIVWEVIILGRIDRAFEILRQNFAIAWMMLTMVEGISRTEGGIGALLLNQNKHFQLDAVFAIQMTIFVIGIGMDYCFGVLRTFFFPYAAMTTQEAR